MTQKQNSTKFDITVRDRLESHESHRQSVRFEYVLGCDPTTHVITFTGNLSGANLTQYTMAHAKQYGLKIGKWSNPTLEVDLVGGAKTNKK